MTKQADMTLENNILYLIGELDFQNVMTVYRKSLSQFQQCPELLVDLSKLISSNSAGLALMVEWTKLAKALNKTIQFKNTSPKLLSIIKAANLDKIIPMS